MSKADVVKAECDHQSSPLTQQQARSHAMVVKAADNSHTYTHTQHDKNGNTHTVNKNKKNDQLNLQ